jgi:KDO2-lipid IV(A) lauroyltransferase
MKSNMAVKIYKTGSWLCWKIPPQISYRLAAVFGELYYWVARRHSRYADNNIRVVLGEKKVNRRVRLVARRSFRNYVKYMVDFLRLPHIDVDQINSKVVGVGWDHIAEALAAGKGAMLITPHFGNWDTAAALMPVHGYQVSTVAKDFEPPELNELIQGARRAQGLTIYSLKDSFRGLYTTLKNNGLVVLLLDSPLQSEGVVVDFFGSKARLASGPATLALRTGAKVLLGYIVRQPGNRQYYGCWEPPLRYELTGDKDRDIQIITQAIANAIENLVRRHPDQWYMFRPLFMSEAEVAEYHHRQRQERRTKTERQSRKVSAVARVEEEASNPL